MTPGTQKDNQSSLSIKHEQDTDLGSPCMAFYLKPTTNFRRDLPRSSRHGWNVPLTGSSKSGAHVPSGEGRKHTHLLQSRSRNVCTLYQGTWASHSPQPDTVRQRCGLGIALLSTFQNIVMGDAQMFKCGQLALCFWADHRAHFSLTAAGLQLLISMVIPMGLD